MHQELRDVTKQCLTVIFVMASIPFIFLTGDWILQNSTHPAPTMNMNVAQEANSKP